MKDGKTPAALPATQTSNATPFTIMIPPPNVTGSLHMGHALTFTIQDTLIRWRRMQGRDALWQPGTDHAGIATQMVVERLLAEEGKDRRDLGRDAFVERVWQWKAESGGTITRQLRRLGASLDWPRERFTMDDGLSAAVKETFVTLYEEGLIYRDRRLVNWDPKLQTAISDLEVENREIKGSLWYLRYPIEGEPGQSIIVATTRPETMLGDTAVAVHPDHPVYGALIGKRAILPLVGRSIPIIADTYADPEKGTGAVKITPAHDFNDFEVGRRHDLPMPSVLDRRAMVTLAEIEDALTAVPGVADPQFVRSLAGQTRFAARSAIVAELERLELLDRIEPHVNQIPHGDRGGVPVEPLLTTQWYCNAGALAKPAIEAVETGKTVFVPRQWENTFFAWMRDIQPWCISRQLWWGHRIPAWYGPDGTVFVAKDPDAAAAQARAYYGQRRSVDTGRGRAGHLVQFRPLAVLNPGLARKNPGTSALLPRRRSGHWLRHHLFLGRADDDAGAAYDGRRAISGNLHSWPGTRRTRSEDVEIPRQRHRPAGVDRPLRRRRPALYHLRPDRSGPRRETQRGARGELPRVRDEAVECRAVLRNERDQP